MAYVAPDWLFYRNVAAPGPVRQGQVTFVLLRGPARWRIAQGHFADHPLRTGE